jgi:cobalt/nickel transport system permease protein
MFDRHLHHPNAHSTGDGNSYLARIDPRARLLAAVGLSVAVAAGHRPATVLLALAAAVLGIALSGLSPDQVLRRVLPLEAVLLLVVLVLPWMASPAAGPPGLSQQGLLLAGMIALKANALVLGLMALVGTMDSVTLGHAMAHLRVPQKLTHLFLLTVRYLDVLHREYVRLRAAMKVRCFRPRLGRHAYRSLGYLAGMLLVRSFDRSERVLAAMKCRGFRGRFWMLDHFAFSARRDLPFCAAAMTLLAAILALELA